MLTLFIYKVGSEPDKHQLLWVLLSITLLDGWLYLCQICIASRCNKCCITSDSAFTFKIKNKSSKIKRYLIIKIPLDIFIRTTNNSNAWTATHQNLSPGITTAPFYSQVRTCTHLHRKQDFGANKVHNKYIYSHLAQVTPSAHIFIPLCKI